MARARQLMVSALTVDLPPREALLDVAWLERQHAEHGTKGLEMCLRRGAERYGGAVTAVADALVSYDAHGVVRLRDSTELRHFLTHRLRGGSWSAAPEGPRGYQRKASWTYQIAGLEPARRDDFWAKAQSKGHVPAPTPPLPSLSELQLLPSVEAAWIGHEGGIWGCDVSLDGRHVVSASRDRSLAVWDMAADRLLSRANTDHGEVRDCLFTPDGTRLISVHADGRVVVRAMENMLPAFTIDTPLPTTLRWRRVAVSPDSERLAVAGWDGNVDVWDLRAGTRGMRLQAASEGQPIGVFLPSSTTCVAVRCGEAMSVLTWDLATEKLVDRVTIETARQQFTVAALTPDQRYLVASGSSGAYVDMKTTVWTLDGPEVAGDVKGDIAGRAQALSADGSLLVTSTSRWHLQVRAMPNLREIARWYLPDLGCRDLACAVAFTPDGSGLIVAGWEGVLRRIALPRRPLNAEVVLNLLAGYARGFVPATDDSRRL